jgi:hypothetical protein
MEMFNVRGGLLQGVYLDKIQVCIAEIETVSMQVTYSVPPWVIAT